MKKKELLIELIFPFGISRMKFNAEFRQLANESLEQLESLSGKITFDVMNAKTLVSISVSANSSFHRGFDSQWPQERESPFWEYRFIKLAVRGEIDASPEARKGLQVLGEKKKRLLCQRRCSWILQPTNLIMCAEIYSSV